MAVGNKNWDKEEKCNLEQVQEKGTKKRINLLKIKIEKWERFGRKFKQCTI